jgi:hypothetical protein
MRRRRYVEPACAEDADDAESRLVVLLEAEVRVVTPAPRS